MKISFIMNVRMPTEKAHGYQIAKMCEALAAAGAEVSLFTPTRKNDIQQDVFSYYGVDANFSVNYVSAFDGLAFFQGSRFGFYVQALSFLWGLRRVSISYDTVIITRNPEIAWLYVRKGYRVFYDAHNFPSHGVGLMQLLLRDVSGVIANSYGTAEAFRCAGITNVFVAPNAVDLEQFVRAGLRERSGLGLPSGSIAMYVGHLYEWKGVGAVIKAARQSNREDLTFVFVGGTDRDLAFYRDKTSDMKNVLFVGHRSRNEIPVFLKSADVLLLPNIPSTQESISYTSPIKMFEYMASGVPIVASDLPSIREVLDDTNSILVEAGNPTELLTGITRALGEDAKGKALRAKKQVKEYTWSARAQKILGFIKI